MDYRSAGVDREGSQKWVEGLKSKIESSFRPEVLTGIGGFGAAFESPKKYKEPIFMAGTDGVGTKLLLAEDLPAECYRSIGQDLVAMCVNDLVAARAEPLVFLDYMATGKLDSKRDSFLIEGIVEACKQSNCSLIGGETAEMPGVYPVGRLDVAGFCVGVLEKSSLWDFSKMRAGDVLLGVKSSGFHSNGYSLVRKIIEKQGWSLGDTLAGENLGEALIRPTELYVKNILPLLESEDARAAVHITGGAFYENLPRVLPPTLGVQLEREAFAVPPVMAEFIRVAGIEEKEAFSTWNMGIGFVLIVSPSYSEELLADKNLDLKKIGSLVSRGAEPVNLI